MDTKTSKERLLINLRKGNAEKVAAIIKQFPGIKIKIFHVGQSVRRSVLLNNKTILNLLQFTVNYCLNRLFPNKTMLEYSNILL